MLAFNEPHTRLGKRENLTTIRQALFAQPDFALRRAKFSYSSLRTTLVGVSPIDLLPASKPHSASTGQSFLFDSRHSIPLHSFACREVPESRF